MKRGTKVGVGGGAGLLLGAALLLAWGVQDDVLLPDSDLLLPSPGEHERIVLIDGKYLSSDWEVRLAREDGLDSVSREIASLTPDQLPGKVEQLSREIEQAEPELALFESWAKQLQENALPQVREAGAAPPLTDRRWTAVRFVWESACGKAWYRVLTGAHREALSTGLQLANLGARLLASEEGVLSMVQSTACRLQAAQLLLHAESGAAGLSSETLRDTCRELLRGVSSAEQLRRLVKTQCALALGQLEWMHATMDAQGLQVGLGERLALRWQLKWNRIRNAVTGETRTLLELLEEAKKPELQVRGAMFHSPAESQSGFLGTAALNAATYHALVDAPSAFPILGVREADLQLTVVALRLWLSGQPAGAVDLSKGWSLFREAGILEQPPRSPYAAEALELECCPPRVVARTLPERHRLEGLHRLTSGEPILHQVGRSIVGELGR